MKKIYLVHGCGRRYEMSSPLAIKDSSGKSELLKPEDDAYFNELQKRYKGTNIKVIMVDVPNELSKVSSTQAIINKNKQRLTATNMSGKLYVCPKRK